MKKIPTLYVRDYSDPKNPVLTDDVTPGCEWVHEGEGTPLRKHDGVAVMLDDEDRWWVRRQVKPGKATPEDYLEVERDETTGISYGWEPAHLSGFQRPLREAVDAIALFGGPVGIKFQPGTFELVGPKVNGNPENAPAHRLIRHTRAEVVENSYIDCRCVGARMTGECLSHDCQYVRDLDQSPWALIEVAEAWGWEGIVWCHPDGRRAKLKVRDKKQRV